MNTSGNYDCLLAKGGPMIVPCPYDTKYYDSLDLLDLIEDGFYDDYDPYDNLEVSRTAANLGA
jgi:hypothetical protein